MHDGDGEEGRTRHSPQSSQEVLGGMLRWWCLHSCSTCPCWWWYTSDNNSEESPYGWSSALSSRIKRQSMKLEICFKKVGQTIIWVLAQDSRLKQLGRRQMAWGLNSDNGLKYSFYHLPVVKMINVNLVKLFVPSEPQFPQR